MSEAACRPGGIGAVPGGREQMERMSHLPARSAGSRLSPVFLLNPDVLLIHPALSVPFLAKPGGRTNARFRRSAQFCGIFLRKPWDSCSPHADISGRGLYCFRRRDDMLMIDAE